jgi:hypothetical protein
MSTHPTARAGVAGYPEPDVSATRPATLTAAIAAAIAAALLNIVGAVVILASVNTMVRNQIAQHPTRGGEPVDPASVDPGSDRGEALHTVFLALGGSMIFWAIVLIVFAYFTLRGGRTMRVLASLVLVATALVKAGDVIVVVPTISKVMDVLVVVSALAAIVLFFMPATNEYGRRHRMQRGRPSIRG